MTGVTATGLRCMWTPRLTSPSTQEERQDDVIGVSSTSHGRRPRCETIPVGYTVPRTPWKKSGRTTEGECNPKSGDHKGASEVGSE